MITPRFCKQCTKSFKPRYNCEKTKFCSRKCFSKSIIGHKGWNKGIKGWLSKKHIESIRKTNRILNLGKKNRNYKNKTWMINPKTGKAWTFKGIINTKRYILEYKPNHPNANKSGYVFQHRLIMEKHINRYLARNEVVHHIDGNKKNNSIENLKIMSHGEHSRFHHLGKKYNKSISSDSSDKH